LSKRRHLKKQMWHERERGERGERRMGFNFHILMLPGMVDKLTHGIFAASDDGEISTRTF